MTEERKKKKSVEISRRDFLKDAGLLVGGAALGSTILLAACAGEPETTTITKTVTGPGTTSTVTGPGTTSTVTGPGMTSTVTGPGMTTTVTGPGMTSTVTAPGATTTVTGPGATTTLPGATITLPGSTVTLPGTTTTLPGTTVTQTVTVTDPEASTLVTVLNPEGQRSPIELKQLAPRLTTLEGKTIYLVDVNFTATWQFLEELEKYVKEKIPSATVVRKIKAGSYAAADPALWNEVEANADAWIMATGH